MKKLFLLLLVSLALSGCGSDEQASSDSCNNYIFSEIVIDGTRGYCVTGYLGTEENLNLSIPKSYNGLSVIGVSFDHAFYNEHCFFNDNNLESIYFPATIKLINLEGMRDSFDDDKTKFIFDADVKHIVCDDKGYEDRISKIFFNGSLDEFTGSNLDSVFRVSDVYFKEGSEYNCKIERNEEIKYVLKQASNSSIIYDAACSISNINKEVTLPTKLNINYKGQEKNVYVTYTSVSNGDYSTAGNDFVLEDNKLKYVGPESVSGGTYVDLFYSYTYRNITKNSNVNFAVVFNDIFSKTKMSMQGGATSNADLMINNIMNAVSGKSYSTNLPASKFFLVFYSNTSEKCGLLKYPLASNNFEVASIDVFEETTDSTNYKTAFVQFLERHQDFFEMAGGAAYDSNYYANGYLSDNDIEYLETADPNNFLTPTILLIDLNYGKKGVTEVAFDIHGDTVQERKQFLIDMWYHKGSFAAK